MHSHILFWPLYRIKKVYHAWPGLWMTLRRTTALNSLSTKRQVQCGWGIYFNSFVIGRRLGMLSFTSKFFTNFFLFKYLIQTDLWCSIFFKNLQSRRNLNHQHFSKKLSSHSPSPLLFVRRWSCRIEHVFRPQKQTEREKFLKYFDSSFKLPEVPQLISFFFFLFSGVQL